MASKFDLRRFVSEFVNYVNVVRPWDAADGILDMQVEFSVIRGRLAFVASLPGMPYDDDLPTYFLVHVHDMLTRAVRDLNYYNGFSDLGKNRTFVLSVDPGRGRLVYGVGGA